MPLQLKAKKLTEKKTSEEIKLPGDYYITDSLGSTDPKVKPHIAIILKCPFCGLDMATTRAQAKNIEYKKTWWERWCGYKGKINIPTMIQCGYESSHRFTIKRGKVIPILK